MAEPRKLLVDEGKCIGCLACSNVCEAGLITLEDEEGVRTLHLPQVCSVECTLCVEACPEKSLSLAASSEGAFEGGTRSIEFELLLCGRCGAPFITEPMMNKLLTAIPAELQADADGFSWIRICPVCRKRVQRKRAEKGFSVI